MKTVIWLKTARVYGHAPDNTQLVERITVKLEAGDNFNKFVRHLNLKGYIESEPPTVVKVLTLNKAGEYEETDKSIYQAQVEEALKPKSSSERVEDYKVSYQNQLIKNQELADRLAKLEAKNEPVIDDELEKAREDYKDLFGKKANVNMKLETIKNKIEEKLNS